MSFKMGLQIQIIESECRFWMPVPSLFPQYEGWPVLSDTTVQSDDAGLSSIIQKHAYWIFQKWKLPFKSQGNIHTHTKKNFMR